MNIEVIRRICLARHLFELGTGSLRSSNDLYLFSAVNLMQDAVEAFLLAVADHCCVGIDANTHFDKYFTLINAKITPKELPFRTALLRLNRVRVDSKHYAIQPAKDECTRLSLSVREFFEEVSSSILNVNFATVSTIDLLKDGEVKNLLIEAREAYSESRFDDVSILCRKAVYIEIEKRFDISEFREGVDPKRFGMRMGPHSDAPFYAKSNDYIVKYVKEPTDYIVYDHSSLDQELLKYGIDNTVFWNVWRLTPKVYRDDKGAWAVKHEFSKLEQEVLADKIEYIFNATIDMVYSVHIKKDMIKYGDYREFFIYLNQENVPVYEKADLASKVVAMTPPGMQKVDCYHYTLGFNDDGPFWHISHYEEGIILSGYIHNDYVGRSD